MKVVAECNGFLMLVDENVTGLDIDTVCRVYNPHLNVLAPEMKAGSWVNRMGPWVKPAKNYDAAAIIAKAKRD